VVRGGSWFYDQWSSRCAYRGWLTPVDLFYGSLGFRLVVVSLALPSSDS